MQRNQQDFRTEKYLRYGIRKYSFGAASVAIAAGLMFLGNGAVSATEVQGAEVSSVTTANLGNQADSKDKSVKAEADKVEEAKKVKKEILEASISTLESKLSTAKYAEAFVLSSAKEALATAKATLANAEASQAEVDQQAATVSALSLVVTESNTAGFDKKQAVDQEAAKAEAEKTATPVEKALSVATTTLTQVSSEAEATNKLAETQLAKADVKEENKAAVTAAVAKNQAVLAETKTLLADKSVTKEQVDAQLERLNESILAVYNELKKAGIGRDGKFEAVLPSTTGTTTGKVDTVKNDTIERYKNFKNYKYGASFLGVENKQQYTADKNNGIMWYDFGKAYKSGGKFTAISNDLGKPTTDISIYETTNENLKRDAQAAGVTKAAGYQLALQVGTVFEQEMYPGYVVRMEVTELKPYETTDIYKERAQKAGVEVKHTKDNSEITKNSIRYDGREVDVVIQKEKEGNPRNAGIVTGNMFNRFGPARDNATVGVTWKLTRFLNGKELKGADVLLADGEQLTNTETVNYVTDGGNWELVEEANAQHNQQGDPLSGATLSVSSDGNGGYKWPNGSYAEGYAAPLRRWSLTSVDDLKQETYLVGGARNSKHEGGTEDYRDFFNRKNNNYYKAYLDLDENGEPKLGLGTQVMGPYHTFNVNSHYNTNSAELGYASRHSWNASKTIPIFGSRDAQHVSVYINAAGMQNAMIGFLAEDRGDAPLTYGEARHSINSVNQRTGDRIQQPYLGSALPDFERKTEVTQENGKYVSKPIETTPWTGDDDTNVTNNPGTKDEGEEQLVGEGKKYSVVTLSDGTTTISFKASNGSGEFDKADGTKQTLSGKAYVRGWIDFNENGRFDPEEESDVVEINGNNQDVTLRFSNKARTEAALNGKVSELGTRIRIAMSKNEILVPTGSAATGEVEDFKSLTTTAPKGSVKKTSGAQGEKQSAVLTFTAFGTQNTDHSVANTIDTTKLPVIVSADGVEHGQSYTVTGQGTYTVDNDGLVTFTPEATFVGTADGIFVRRVDKNGNSTGWTSTILQDKDTAVTAANGRSTYTNFDGSLDVTKAVEKTVTLNGAATTSMDAVYIPTVTPKELEGKNVDSTDIQGKPQKKTPTFNLADTTTAVTPSDKYPAKLVDASGNKVETLKVDGQGTYTINPTTGEVTFTPEPNFKGTAKPVTIELETAVGSDKNGTPVLKKATATYTPTVVGATPTAQPATSTGIQGDTQTGTVAFTAGKATVEGVEKEVPLKANSAKLLNADGSVPTEATVPAYAADGVTKVGTYSIDPSNNTVTFTPTDKTYKGTVQPANVQAEDENGTTVKTTYTPHIVGVAPTATPAESTNIQGEVQSGVVTFAPGKATIDNVEKSVAIKEGSVKLVNADGSVPTEATVPAYAADGVTKVGTYSIDPSNNTVTFTPTDKTYKGTVLPANVQAEDENGTTVKTTYTPHIVGVVPTAEPATSTDIQGVEQSKEVTFTPGKTEINGTEKTVAIDTTSFKLLDENENAVDSVPAKNPAGDVIGTYTLKVVDGKVNAVFTPTDKTYAGEVEPVTIQAKDTNGTVVKTTYTPSITPVEPSGTPTTSEGIQGAKQEGTPSFTPGDERIPMKIDADQPAKLVNPETGKPTDDTTIPAKDNDGNTVGTYTIEPTTGKVTFTPNKDFTGTPVAATVQAKDANGTPTTATYEPTVKPVTPTGSDTVTEDVQGSIQKGKPTFEGGTVTVNGEEKTVAIDEDKPAKLVDPKTGDPVESVTIDGEGTYTVTPDGTVTFTPEKNFTGKGTGVTVQREDKNATPVTAKYTPVVKPATPTSSDVITTNVQGAIQEGTPTFTGGKVTINGQEKTVAIDEAVKPKFDDGTTEKVVPNEGTYTIDENGKVTFTPEKTFTGQAAGVTVKRVDKNGTPVTAKYTPVVIPVSPTSKDAESEGPKGQSQEGTPTFTGGKVTLNGKEVPVAIDENVKPKFDDGTTEKVVPNEGTYTIDENGKVTFTPEPNFVGKATGVTVKRVDKNGTPVTAKYTPTVRPDTRFVVIEKDGKETDLLPSKDGAKPSEPIPGYNVVRTEIDEKGNTKHIYEKVKTSFKDKEGNEIPKYPSEPGTVDKKDIPEYRFVETKKLPNGDTEHIYEKVKTSFKDKEGNEIPKYPSEPGTVDKKDIPEYRFVETKKLPNGDTEHIYEKVKTSFKDKEGKEIPNYPTEDGDQPKKDILGYRFVETKKLPNGDTEHVYEKVTTFFKDKDGNEISEKVTGSVDKKDIPGYRFVETKKLPNGDIEHVYEKVSTPSPAPQPHPGKQNTTTWTDENGNPLKPTEPGSKEPGRIPGYEYVKTVTGSNGNIRHIFRKVEMPTPTPVEPVQPVSPQEPETPEQPVTPEMPTVPEQPKQPTTPKYVDGQKELPNTGTEANASLAALGLLGALGGFGLLARKKKED